MNKILIFIFIQSITIACFSQQYNVFKPSVNTDEYQEFGASRYKDLLVFASDIKADGFMNFTKLTVFYVSFFDDSIWSKPKLLSFDLLSNYYDGPVVYDNINNRIYYTSCTKSIVEQLGDNNNCKCKLRWRNKNRRWDSHAVEFAYNGDGTKVMHPAFNKNKTEMYFSANYEDSYGGNDIYKTVLYHGKWSEPENMGNIINSEFDEMYPFFTSDGRLFFSSNNENSMGGMDIFYTEKLNGNWIKPVPLKPPVNSDKNDISVYFDDKAETGYFSSDRDGSYDIFSLASASPAFKDCIPAGELNRCAVFTEEGYQKTDTTKYIYTWNFGDGSSRTGYEVEHCYNDTGTFIVSLDVKDIVADKTKKNVISSKIRVYDNEILYFDVQKNLKVNEEFEINNVINNMRGFQNAVYYWNMGDGTVFNKKDIKHKYKKAGKYYIKLGIINKNTGEKHCVYKKVNVTN